MSTSANETPGIKVYCISCENDVVPVFRRSEKLAREGHTACPNCGAFLGTVTLPQSQSGPIAGRTNF